MSEPSRIIIGDVIDGLRNHGIKIHTKRDPETKCAIYWMGVRA